MIWAAFGICPLFSCAHTELSRIGKACEKLTKKIVSICGWVVELLLPPIPIKRLKLKTRNFCRKYNVLFSDSDKKRKAKIIQMYNNILYY
jgi:hypothetical protein